MSTTKEAPASGRIANFGPNGSLETEDGKQFGGLDLSTDTLAFLIDADNASPKVISGLLAEIANYGTASVKRIYGDWTKPNLSGWKECLLEHSIQPSNNSHIRRGRTRLTER